MYLCHYIPTPTFCLDKIMTLSSLNWRWLGLSRSVFLSFCFAGIGHVVRKLIFIALFRRLVSSVTVKLVCSSGTSLEFWHDWNANWTTRWLNTSVLSTTCAWKSAIDSHLRRIVRICCNCLDISLSLSCESDVAAGNCIIKHSDKCSSGIPCSLLFCYLLLDTFLNWNSCVW